MLEGIIVDAPQFFPWHCVACQSTTGPLVDTSVELAGGLRVYLCASCVRLAGIKLELIDAEKSDKRKSAMTRLAAAEQELEALRGRLAGQTKAVEDHVRISHELKMSLEQSQGRVAQLEQAIVDRARAELAMVQG